MNLHVILLSAKNWVTSLDLAIFSICLDEVLNVLALSEIRVTGIPPLACKSMEQEQK